MTGGARPAAGLPAAGQHEPAARPGDRPAGQAAVPAASRRGRPWMRSLAAAAVAAAAVRAPAAASDLRAAFAHAGGLRVSWLGVAVAAEVMSLAGAAAAQRRLLSAAGVSLPWRTVSGAVFASTGLARVMPAGPAAGGAWQAAEYRRRGAGAVAGLWAVLAGGYTSTVAVSALLLAGAAVAGISCLPLLGGAAGVLAAGTAGLTAAAHHAGALSRWLSRRHHRSRTIAPLAAAVAGLSRPDAGSGWAAAVLGCTVAGLLADAGLLAACFGLAGLPVPWRGLLFAYAAGQLAGRLVPLPGGLGGVEGGVLGALTLTGTPPAAAAAAVILYRVAGYWAAGAAGTAAAATLTRRGSRGPGMKPPTSQRAAMTRTRTAFRPWQRPPDQPAQHALAASARDPGPRLTPAPPAGPGRQAQPGTGNPRPRPQPAPHPAGARNQETPMTPTDPRPGEDDDTGCDDDTDYDYYDTPTGNIWRPGAEPGRPPGDEPGRPGRGASLSFPDRPHAASPPERGPVRPGKETA
jgi:putative heme transporter